VSIKGQCRGGRRVNQVGSREADAFSYRCGGGHGDSRIDCGRCYEKSWGVDKEGR
jgi:hypothetical protein